MYKKSIRIRKRYKLLREPGKSYCEKERFRLVTDLIDCAQEIFEVEGSRGYAKIIIEDGVVIKAYCATWNCYKIEDEDKVLSKFMQISQKGFIEVYKSLNKKSHWYNIANIVLERKKQKLSTKQKLTKTEKELLEL